MLRQASTLTYRPHGRTTLPPVMAAARLTRPSHRCIIVDKTWVDDRRSPVTACAPPPGKCMGDVQRGPPHGDVPNWLSHWLK